MIDSGRFHGTVPVTVLNLAVLLKIAAVPFENLQAMFATSNRSYTIAHP